MVIRKVGHTEVFNCTEIKATDLNYNKAERLQLCPINKTYKAEQQVSYRTLSPVSWGGSHQISSIQILNFPFVLIISLDTKPQEPETGCQ